MADTSSVYEWEGRALKGRSGDKIGKIEALYVDAETDKPEWALVNTGLFGTKSSFVPLAGASPSGDDVVAQVDAAQVKEAPKVEADGELSEQEEAELFRHYGVEYTSEGSVTATGNGTITTSGRSSQAASKRSRNAYISGVPHAPMSLSKKPSNDA